ncbi:MAG: N-acetylmuramoyl-L-alanine amidase-like domain-containing protein [Pseudolabrys sp.]
MRGLLQRREVLRLLAGGASFAVAGGPVLAARRAEPKLPRLIAESQALPGISARIDLISKGLIGTRYRGHTLIGGPKTSEVLVMREDGFDCVTFCETVLAAARVRTPDEFAPALRQIRYHDGMVTWFARNHYHHQWSTRNVENRFCRDIELPGAVTIEKTVTWHRALGKQQFTMRVNPVGAFVAHRAMLRTGDIVGFVTRRTNLDYFHTGFVAFGPKGELLLRHASQSRGRVLDEPMARFIRASRAQYVTVLRPLDPAAGASASKT